MEDVRPLTDAADPRWNGIDRALYDRLAVAGALVAQAATLAAFASPILARYGPVAVQVSPAIAAPPDRGAGVELVVRTLSERPLAPVAVAKVVVEIHAIEEAEIDLAATFAARCVANLEAHIDRSKG